MSRLGKLCADILVDGGALQPHYGSDDPIRGQVFLSYEPVTNILKRKTTPADLFGPLKIQAKVHGKINIRVRKQRELPTRHDMDLFCQTINVFEGPFKAEAGKKYPFPWSFTFPQDARPISSAAWVPTPTTSTPPSFGMHFSAHHDLVDVRIEYLLEVLVSVAGINVKTIVPPENCRPAINYSRPRLSSALVDSSSSTFQERVRISSRRLEIPGERKSGLKAVLDSSRQWETPEMTRLSLDVICTNHRQIYAGQMLTYRVKLSRAELGSVAISIPRTTLRSLKVELVATTSVNTSERIIGPKECVDKRNMQSFAASRSVPADFCESNNHAVDIVLERVVSVPCSFAHRKVSRSYLFRIEMELQVADKIVSVKRDCPVAMVPKPTDAEPSNTWSSAPPWSLAEEEMSPPSYEETTTGNTTTSNLSSHLNTAGMKEKEHSKV